MNGYNFTADVRQSLAFAREEAAALNNEDTGTEHILLGLLRTKGVGQTVLQSLNVDLDALRGEVIRRVKRGANPGVGRDLPYTSSATKCLELTMSEARELDHSYCGTEHLLLGLLREGKGIAAQVLTDAGITLERAREETLRVLGGDDRALLEEFKAHGTVTPAAFFSTPTPGPRHVAPTPRRSPICSRRSFIRRRRCRRPSRPAKSKSTR